MTNLGLLKYRSSLLDIFNWTIVRTSIYTHECLLTRSLCEIQLHFTQLSLWSSKSFILVFHIFWNCIILCEIQSDTFALSRIINYAWILQYYLWNSKSLHMKRGFIQQDRHQRCIVLWKTNLMSSTYLGYRLHTLFQYSLATTRLLDLQDLLDIEVPELEE